MHFCAVIRATDGRTSRIADEVEALRRIGGRWRFVLRGIHASPLEGPCGGVSPFREAVDRLRGSALVWPAVDHQAMNQSTAARLDRIERVASEGLFHFEACRTKAPPEAMSDDTPDPNGWASAYCIAPHVHRWAKATFFAMQSSSRLTLEDCPASIAELVSGGFYGPPHPLGGEHLAALAALVCLAGAIYELDGVLLHWRWAVGRASPELHFDGQAGTDEWESAIYAARQDAWLRSDEAERLGTVSGWIARAESWIACAAQIIDAQAKTRWAVDRATTDERTQQRTKRATASSKTLEAQEKTSAANKTKVEAAARRLGTTTPRRELTGKVAKSTGLSRPTVAKYLRELGVL